MIEVVFKATLKNSTVNIGHLGLENHKHEAFTSAPLASDKYTSTSCF